MGAAKLVGSLVRMKAKALLLAAIVMSFAASATAQAENTTIRKEPDFLTTPNWNIGVWADYANGIGTRTDVRAGGAGLRIGRVLTNQHGGGWMRGTLEYDVDVTPVEIYHLPAYQPLGSAVVLPAKNYYTAGFNPFVLKWNFTRSVGQAFVPYVAAEGGLVFSNGNLPQGDTSSVNFTSGLAIGAHLGRSDSSAWTVQAKIYHLSNASLGNHNPGVNAALQFKIGYTWFKH